MDEKKTWGGRREGSGRPSNGRNIPVCIKLSRDAVDILNTKGNKSEYIDELIKKSK